MLNNETENDQNEVINNKKSPPDIKTDNNNGWIEWSKYVLNSIEVLNDTQEKITEKFQKKEVEDYLKHAQLKEDLTKDYNTLSSKMQEIQIRLGFIFAVVSMVGSAIVVSIIHVLKELFLKIGG